MGYPVGHTASREHSRRPAPCDAHCALAAWRSCGSDPSCLLVPPEGDGGLRPTVAPLMRCGNGSGTSEKWTVGGIDAATKIGGSVASNRWRTASAKAEAEAFVIGFATERSYCF